MGIGKGGTKLYPNVHWCIMLLMDIFVRQHDIISVEVSVKWSIFPFSQYSKNKVLLLIVSDKKVWCIFLGENIKDVVL